MKYKIKKTNIFNNWMHSLKDKQAIFSIHKRLIRVVNGNFGDHKNLGDKIFELRIFVGKGYRIYYTVSGDEVILLLCGGHKGTQKKDIDKAKALIKEIDHGQI